MNKWLKAFRLDILGQEGKSTLAPEEKQMYTLGLGVVSMLVGVMCIFLQFPFSLSSLIFFAIGARKYQIYWNKRNKT